MIHSFYRHLLDRFVLRPSRHQVAYAPKHRVVVSDQHVTDEYFVQWNSARGSDATGENESKERTDLLVLKFPGTAGRAERASIWPAGHFPELTTKVCTWNAPGYGGSSGRATLSNIAKGATRFWRHATSELGASSPRIWLVGNSLGCATATYLAAQHRDHVAGLVLRNPPPLIETVKRVARRYPLGHLTDAIAESLPAEMNLLITASDANVPTVMLQSECDELVPPALQMKVYDRLPGPKRMVVMKGLAHDGITSDEHQQEIDDALRWLWKSVDEAKSAGKSMLPELM